MICIDVGQKPTQYYLNKFFNKKYNKAPVKHCREGAES